MSDGSLLRRGGVAYAGIPLAEMMAGLIWGWLASIGMGRRRAGHSQAWHSLEPGRATHCQKWLCHLEVTSLFG
jgi:hypothetical protein